MNGNIMLSKCCCHGRMHVYILFAHQACIPRMKGKIIFVELFIMMYLLTMDKQCEDGLNKKTLFPYNLLH